MFALTWPPAGLIASESYGESPLVSALELLVSNLLKGPRNFHRLSGGVNYASKSLWRPSLYCGTADPEYVCAPTTAPGARTV